MDKFQKQHDEQIATQAKLKSDIAALEAKYGQNGQPIQPKPANKGILDTIASHKAMQGNKDQRQKSKSHISSKDVNANIPMGSSDTEEVLVDAADNESKEESYRKATKSHFTKDNYQVTDQLPNMSLDDELVDKIDEQSEIIDLSSDLSNMDRPRENQTSIELHPLPSPDPDQDSKRGVVEDSKSIEQIKIQKSQTQVAQAKPEIEAKKPEYSFLGMSGGGLSRSKQLKSKPSYQKMARDEFKPPINPLKAVKQGDDYYYSLKENQFCLTEKNIQREMYNSIQISMKERKQGVYSEKYSQNLEHHDSYVFNTAGLDSFVLEIAQEGPDAEEEECIVIDESLLSEGENDLEF